MMTDRKYSFRRLKKIFKRLLCQNDFESAINEINQYPARQALNPLISLLCSCDSQIEQNVIKAIGIIVSGLAEDNIESARIIMRRLMWSLNDESGGIGWGAPEAMAEIMVRHKRLAEEYHKILISYAKPGKNYLENEALQESVRRGIKKLAAARQELLNAYPADKLI